MVFYKKTCIQTEKTNEPILIYKLYLFQFIGRCLHKVNNSDTDKVQQDMSWKLRNKITSRLNLD